MRVAFKMFLNKNCIDEYKRRHNDIWPELVDVLKKYGIHRYSIFYDASTNELFAVHDLESNNSAKDLGMVEVVQQWWEYMADLMEVNSDNSPVVMNLDETFYLE